MHNWTPQQLSTVLTITRIQYIGAITATPVHCIKLYRHDQFSRYSDVY